VRTTFGAISLNARRTKKGKPTLSASPSPRPRSAQRRKRKFFSRSTHALNGLPVEGAVAAVIARAEVIVDAVAVVWAARRGVVTMVLRL